MCLKIDTLGKYNANTFDCVNGVIVLAKFTLKNVYKIDETLTIDETLYYRCP